MSHYVSKSALDGAEPGPWEDVDEHPINGALLIWARAYLELYVPGKDVVHQEELMFIVHETKLLQNPFQLDVRAFNVRDQEVQTITFKLKVDIA